MHWNVDKRGYGPKAIPIEGSWLKLYRISIERGFWDLALENPAMDSNCCWAMQYIFNFFRLLREGRDKY